MDVQTWKTKARERLQAFANQINTTASGMVYGGLAAATLLPVVSAAYQGDFSALVALTGVVGGVGGNLIANQLQAWKDRSEQAIANELAEKAQTDPEWRQTLDTVLREFEAPRVVQAILSEADKDDLKGWFATMLRQEIAQLGSNLTIEGDWIAGDKIAGDKVGGDKTTVAVKGGTGIAVGKNIKQTVKIVNHYYQQTKTPFDEAQQGRQTVLFETYLQGVMAETGTLDLAGVDRATASNPDAAKLELAAIYTALYTHGGQEMDVGLRKAVDQTLLERGERERQSALAFANQTPYAALLGDPGSGKTTFTNFLALCLAGEWLENPAANLARLGDEWQVGGLLPMRVVLRNFAAQLPTKPLLASQNAGDLLWQHITRRLGESLQEFAPLLKWHLLESGGLLILDGFDEVPEAQARRDIVKEAVRGFRRQFPKVRILLTSRTYAYQRQQWRLPDFAETVLAPFDQEQIAAFVDNWYAHMADVRPNLTVAEAQGRAALLKQSINHNHYLRDLAARPLLLTLMASLHAWRGGALPDDREQLYAESVELLLDIWERPKTVLDDEGKPVLQSESMAEWLRVPQRQIMTALEKLAYTVHASQTALTGTADIEEGQLVTALIAAADNPDLRPQRVVEYIRDRAGLLINRGEHIYSLPHRTFQEYLAARHLTENGFPNELVRLVRNDAERWREVLLLAGAKATRGAPFSGWYLSASLCPRPCDPEKAKETEWWAALLAGQLLTETRIYTKVNPAVDVQERATLERVRGWLAQLVSQGRLSPVDRATAGVVLGRLGDPRPGVGVKNGLPEISWCHVDAGSFIMGGKESWEGGQRFICNLIHQPYRISRYPITVAQYRCFVEAQGYAQRQWWTEAGWQWRQKNDITGPREIGGVFETANHPQVGVSWHEAVAFCRWLAEQSGSVVRLPTEAEWERAARHTDGRIYPWVGEFAVARCNMGETGIGSTSAVGSFPSGLAECGAADMSGNVWEWCSMKWLDDYKDYVAKIDDGLEGADRRVLRGGAWSSYQDFVRCASRYHHEPDYSRSNVGFRVVVPGSGSLAL